MKLNTESIVRIFIPYDIHSKLYVTTINGPGQ